ncbi:MAG: glycosyltransferase family 39 protein [Methanoregula sp.]|nr:glycosyltransferase family 39 protein [Methanoregula sp.]
MARRHNDRVQEKKTRPAQGYNLDGDYISPVRSFQDLSLKNCKSVIFHSRYAQVLIFLTIVGFVLRIYNLGFNSLWLDEATTYYWSKLGFVELWEISRSADFHPPLFHWIEHIMLVFGHSEFILRAAPALLGTLTIPVFYLIGKEIYDKNVGIISAALLTFSYFGIYYSQEAYSYSTVLFIFSFVILFYLTALRTDNITFWVLFGIISAIAFWTHYYVFVGLGVIYLHAIITIGGSLKKDIRHAKNLLVAFCTTLILSLPLLFIVGERFFRLTGSPPTYGVLGPILIQETLVRFSGGYSSFSWIIAFIYLVLMIGGLVYLYSKDRNKCLLCAMFLILPIVISVLISSKMTMNPRYLIYLLPVYFTLVAMSYPIILKLVPNRNLLYLIVILIGVINAPLLAEYYSGYTKEDWRGFAGIVQSKTQDGDVIVLVPSYMSAPFNYYYSNVSDKTFEYGADNSTDLKNIYQLKGNSSIFYIVTGDISAMNPEGDALLWLSEKARLETERTGIYLLTSNDAERQ